MALIVDEEDGRLKRTPRSPRLDAHSPSPSNASLQISDNEPPRGASEESTLTESTPTLTPGLTPNGESTSTNPERADRQITLERGVGDLSLSSPAPEQPSLPPVDVNFTPRSAIFGPPEHRIPVETAAIEASFPLTPRASEDNLSEGSREEERHSSLGAGVPALSLSPPPTEPSVTPLDSADIPLPSVEEVEDPVAVGDLANATPRSSLTSRCQTVESDFDERSATQPTKSATPGLETSDGQSPLETDIADLSLSSPMLEGTPATPERSEPHMPRLGTQDPVTVRDLPNATPRPSLAPRPDSQGTSLEPEERQRLPENTVRESVLGELEQLRLSEENENLTDSDEFSDSEILKFYYDVSKEELPASPFATQRFQDSLKRGVGLAKDIFRCLDDCEIANQDGTQLHRLHQTARRLQEFNSPAKRRIAIVGDSGVGKSSLINSLLGMSELAHRGDSGFAVTSFVTEYRKREAHQTAAFTIRVNCSMKQHIEEQIDDLLFEFRAPHEPGILERLQQDSDEFRDIERKSEVAFSTIDSLLGKYGEITRDFLLDTSSWDTDTSKGSVEDIKTCLHGFAESIEWPQGTEGGQWEETAASPRECRQKVAQFMDNGFWPLIDTVKYVAEPKHLSMCFVDAGLCIRIYLSAQILKTGIILVDLPGWLSSIQPATINLTFILGLRDINLARVKKTERYQHKCDEIFITANIKRVGSDESVKRLISEKVFESPRADLGVSIVCTHADVSIGQWSWSPQLNNLCRTSILRIRSWILP